MPYKMVFIVPVGSKKRKPTNERLITSNKECLSIDNANSFTAKRDLCWREKKKDKGLRNQL